MIKFSCARQSPRKTIKNVKNLVNDLNMAESEYFSIFLRKHKAKQKGRFFSTSLNLKNLK